MKQNGGGKMSYAIAQYPKNNANCFMTVRLSHVRGLCFRQHKLLDILGIKVVPENAEM